MGARVYLLRCQYGNGEVITGLYKDKKVAVELAVSTWSRGCFITLTPVEMDKSLVQEKVLISQTQCKLTPEEQALYRESALMEYFKARKEGGSGLVKEELDARRAMEDKWREQAGTSSTSQMSDMEDTTTYFKATPAGPETDHMGMARQIFGDNFYQPGRRGDARAVQSYDPGLPDNMNFAAFYL